MLQSNERIDQLYAEDIKNHPKQRGLFFSPSMPSC